jgi:hypothetical protein
MLEWVVKVNDRDVHLCYYEEFAISCTSKKQMCEHLISFEQGFRDPEM